MRCGSGSPGPPSGSVPRATADPRPVPASLPLAGWAASRQGPWSLPGARVHGPGFRARGLGGAQNQVLLSGPLFPPLYNVDGALGGAAGGDVYKPSGTVETFSQWRWLLVSTLSRAGDLANLPPVSLSLPSVDREVAPLALSSLWAQILSVCFSAGLSWGLGSGSPCKQHTPSPLPALPLFPLGGPTRPGGGWVAGQWQSATFVPRLA